MTTGVCVGPFSVKTLIGERNPERVDTGMGKTNISPEVGQLDLLAMSMSSISGGDVWSIFIWVMIGASSSSCCCRCLSRFRRRCCCAGDALLRKAMVACEMLETKEELEFTFGLRSS